MIFNDNQRRLVEKVQRDKKHRPIFEQMAEQNLKAAMNYLENVYKTDDRKG